MNKQEFLNGLREALRGLPKEDAEDRLSFYEEMIGDRMTEDGLSEEEAVAELGTVGEVADRIIADTPLAKIVGERIRPKRRFRAWEIVLLVLGFPLWFPLLIAAFAVLLSVYIVIWAVIVSLWAVDLALAASGVAGIAAGVMLIAKGQAQQGLLTLFAGLALAGLSIFLFFGCKAATKGAAKLTKRIALGVKSMFLKRRDEE